MSDSEVDILSHFTSLDELINLIYQGAHKFVVISAVDEKSWTVHVGLSDSGRWWKGTWSEKDVQKIVVRAAFLDVILVHSPRLQGQQPSSIVLESFAERLTRTFVQGDLQIGNWSTERGADIDVLTHL